MKIVIIEEYFEKRDIYKTNRAKIINFDFNKQKIK